MSNQSDDDGVPYGVPFSVFYPGMRKDHYHSGTWSEKADRRIAQELQRQRAISKQQKRGKRKRK